MSYYPASGPGGTAPAPPPRGGRGGDGGWSPGVFSPAIFLVALLVIALLVSAALLSRRSGSPPTATTASGQPTSAQKAAGTATATVAPPSTGPTFVVANTGGDGVYLRHTPNLDDRDTAYPDGTQLTGIGDDVTAGGLVWHHVRAPDGKTGWVPARYTNSQP